MEYVPGGTLARYVSTRGPLPPRAAAALVATVARAAHAAHARDIVHRDIKPGNVLLALCPEQPAGTDLAEALVPKLSDFGLAKRTDRDEGLTIEPGVLGTPGFLAPEQAADELVTPRTDVHGLGATLYFALTGSAPFESADVRSMLDQVISDDPRRVRLLRPEVPVELEAIVHKCLEKDPDRRYHSAEALAGDLDRFAAGDSVAAEPLTPLRRARKALGRKRRLLVRCAAALTVLAAVFVLGTGAGRPVETDETRALKVRTDLADRKDVTLLGRTGKPLWYTWVLGPSAFAPVTGREDACSFQAFGQSMLDLCPDPMTDRYHVRAELCQVDANDRGAAGPLVKGVFEVGFYIGRQRATGKDGWRSDACLCVRFTEVPKEFTGLARFGRLLVSESPVKRATVARHSCFAAPFEPGTALPGPWHVVEFEVTPDDVKLWFDPKGPNPAPSATLPVADLARDYTAPNFALDRVFPDNGIVLPAWNPRGALGVWSYESAVAVRNVTVSPLK
jgi:serine/threonine-protein kinase